MVTRFRLESQISLEVLGNLRTKAQLVFDNDGSHEEQQLLVDICVVS